VLEREAKSNSRPKAEAISLLKPGKRESIFFFLSHLTLNVRLGHARVYRPAHSPRMTRTMKEICRTGRWTMDEKEKARLPSSIVYRPSSMVYRPFPFWPLPSIIVLAILKIIELEALDGDA
jgi:hypothetical protein